MPMTRAVVCLVGAVGVRASETIRRDEHRIGSSPRRLAVPSAEVAARHVARSLTR